MITPKNKATLNQCYIDQLSNHPVYWSSFGKIEKPKHKRNPQVARNWTVLGIQSGGVT